MDKKLLGLVGAVASLGAVDVTAAAAAPVPHQDPLAVSSYAELLQPMPNASRVLSAMEERSSAEPQVQLAQFYYHHHHHHHHHGYWRGPRERFYGRRFHHHHHHHHHGYYRY